MGHRWGRGSARVVEGFSLIELLVVISIIALLVGILLPALGKARSAAHTTACLSNQRQLSVGMESFAVENHDRYPERTPYENTGAALASNGWEDQPGDDGEELEMIKLPELRPARPRAWTAASSTHLRQVSLAFTIYHNDNKRYYPRVPAPEFVCPADPDPTGPTDGEWMPDESIHRSYVFNGFNDVPPQWNYYYTYEVPTTAIRTPWQTAMFGEKQPEADHVTGFYVDIFNVPGDPLEMLTRDRHGGWGNHTFGDGSARLMKPYEAISPLNLWAVTDAARQEYSQYVPPGN